MAKKKIKKSKEASNYLDLSEAVKFESKVKGLFEAFFEEKKKEEIDPKFEKQEKRRGAMIIGVIVASFFVLIVVIADSRFFLAGYNEHYLETQKAFSDEMYTLRKENTDLKKDLEAGVEKIRDKQEYLERIILERSITQE